MAITISPTYPVAGSAVTLSMSATVGAEVVYELTALPPESALSTGLLLEDLPARVTAPTSPVAAAEGDYQTDTFTPDVPGEYMVVGYDIERFLGFAAYPGDPGGVEYYKQLGTQYVTFHVGLAVQLPIVTARGDGGILSIQINDETVRAATIVETTNEKSRVAATITTVVNALAALVGIGVNSIGMSLQVAVNDLWAKYNAHILNVGGVFHYAGGDTVNITETTDADAQAGALLLLRELGKDVAAHLTRASSATAIWHQDGSGNTDDDLKNLPVTAMPTTVAEATVFSADLRERCYERHRQHYNGAAPPYNPPECHARVDDVNVLVAPSLLDAVIVAYLDALETITPTSPAGEPEGIIDAAHKYGFEEI